MSHSTPTSEFDLRQLGRLDQESYVPLYVQLADRFIEVIRSGRAAAGTLLPSESACESYFSVSRLTVRQAMQKLATEGLISRERGRGTFVAPLKVQHDIAFSFEEEMHASNLPIEPRLMSWKRVQPLSEVAAALRTPRGEPVYRLERLRLVAGKPIGREVRHLPKAIGAKLRIGELRTQPIFKLLQQATGQEICRIPYTVSAVPASAHDAALLRVKKGAPLLAREHVYYGREDVPLLHGIAFFVGESYSFHFETGSGQIRMGSKLDWNAELNDQADESKK